MSIYYSKSYYNLQKNYLQQFICKCPKKNPTQFYQYTAAQL